MDNNLKNIYLPKYQYDVGTGGNPWIPKGTKVPTENSKEVIVSM